MRIERLRPARLEEAAGVLARAFHDDPAARRLHPRGSRRHAALLSRFRSLLLGAATSEGVTDEDGALVAVAIWSGYSASPAPALRALRGAVAWLRDPVAALRVAIAAPALHRLQRDARPDGAAELVAIGTEPRHQGRGAGSALLRAGLDRLDARGLACYIETAQPRNLQFYRRHGFSVAAEARPPGGVPTFALLRLSRSAPGR